MSRSPLRAMPRSTFVSFGAMLAAGASGLLVALVKVIEGPPASPRIFAIWAAVIGVMGFLCVTSAMLGLVFRLDREVARLSEEWAAKAGPSFGEGVRGATDPDNRA